MAKKRKLPDVKEIIKKIKEARQKQGGKTEERIQAWEGGVTRKDAEHAAMFDRLERKVKEFEAREGRKASKSDRSELAMNLVAEEVRKKVAALKESMGQPRTPAERIYQDRKIEEEKHFWAMHYVSFFRGKGK